MKTIVMSNNALSIASQLSDQQLAVQVKLLAQHEREATATLIAHLAVLDERGLYRAEGCSSMFTYCLEVLHLSEHAAYGRIEAARAARKYPIILELLGNGSVNLTTVTLLASHLTAENHVDLLAAARHQRKRQVEELVAALRPQPPVPSSIRRLPTPKYTSPMVPADATDPAAAADMQTEPQAASGTSDPAPLSLVPPPLSSPIRRPAVEPHAPERYKVQFTATADTCEKLRLLQDLLRHQIPDGDLGEIMDRALTALLEKVAKQKLAATDRPRQRREPEGKDEAARSRYISAEVRRTVWNRDGGRCAFVGNNGHRCTARGFLEFHHVVPHCVGGQATVHNIELRCRVHNGYEFERASSSWKVSGVREVSATYRGSEWPTVAAMQIAVINSVRTESREGCGYSSHGQGVRTGQWHSGRRDRGPGLIT